jgi:hypothetical protein
MPNERITRRQKDVARLLRDKKKIRRDRLKKVINEVPLKKSSEK